MMRVAIVNDQPPYTGMGRYVHSLYEKLKLHCSVDHIYLNFPDRRIEVGNGETVKIIARAGRVPLVDNKPFFWMRIKEAIPYADYDLLHFANQNLSFLIREDHPSVITCCDLSPLIVKENLIKLLARKYLYSGLSRAKKIISISPVVAQIKNLVSVLTTNDEIFLQISYIFLQILWVVPTNLDWLFFDKIDPLPSEEMVFATCFPPVL